MLTRAQVRELDRRAIEDYGVPGVVLMENAGHGAAEILRGLGAASPVLICCGKGNNGGDGLVIARHLDAWGIDPVIVLFADPADLSGDAALQWRIVQRSGLQTHIQPAEIQFQDLLQRSPWVVDALFGTGLQGPVRPPFDTIIAAINASARRVLAVDLPSGLDCDTGLTPGATIKATHTVTFVAEKAGFGNPAARQWLGNVHIVQIGAPGALLRPLLASSETAQAGSHAPPGESKKS